jgi:predicted nucleotidyltransferase
MDKRTDIAIQKIKSFISILEKNKLHIKNAYLFGSYANGNNNELSDIDFALVSDEFSGDLWEDKKILRQYKHLISWDLSPLPFTSLEFENNFFVKEEVIAKGIKII